jgi:hypothetical protein
MKQKETNRHKQKAKKKEEVFDVNVALDTCKTPAKKVKPLTEKQVKKVISNFEKLMYDQDIARLNQILSKHDTSISAQKFFCPKCGTYVGSHFSDSFVIDLLDLVRELLVYSKE